MDRRQFVKQSCSICLAVSSGILVESLASCATLMPVYETTAVNNKIAIPLVLFAKNDFRIIQVKGTFYNIGVKKEQNGSYTALLLRCTHADNQLSQTGNGFICTLHGSMFNMEGQVTKGPAEHTLKRYKTEILPDNIVIYIS